MTQPRRAAAARFEGRTVVLTGAARGIGRGTLEAFVDEGATVFAVDRDSERLAHAVAALPRGELVTQATADLGAAGEAARVVESAVSELGSVDVLVNNAALMPAGDFAATSEAEFDTLVATNLRAPFFACQAAVRHFLTRGGGTIVNIASTNAFRAESPRVLYNASKAAVVMMSRSLAHEFGHRGIRVNCVAPGETITPEAASEMDETERRTVLQYLARIPLGRAGTVSDIAQAVLFLASSDASFISGQTLIVDGGELTGDWFDVDDRPAPSSSHWWTEGAER